MVVSSVAQEPAIAVRGRSQLDEPSVLIYNSLVPRGLYHRHDASLKGFGQSGPCIYDCGEGGIYLTSVGGHKLAKTLGLNT
jgi:hypothetical protein